MSKEKIDLIKGFYSLFSDYKDNGLGRHSKKGSEIKEGLNAISAGITKRKSEYLDKMSHELSEISFSPDTPCDYNIEYKHLLEYIPKKFSYDIIYHGKKYVKTDNGIDEKAVKLPTTEEKSEMREYNDYARNYINLCVDKIKIDSLKKNIQDNKSYQLSVDQLAILGL